MTDTLDTEIAFRFYEVEMRHCSMWSYDLLSHKQICFHWRLLVSIEI